MARHKSSEALATELQSLFAAKDVQRFAPLALLSFRFDHTRLAGVGSILADACDAYLDQAMGSARLPRWLFGFFVNAKGGYSRAMQPKDLTTAGGRKFLRQALTRWSSLPAAADDCLDLVSKDGEKPWDESPTALLANRSAMRICLGPMDHGWRAGGALSFAFPLWELEDDQRRPRWLKFGDALHGAFGAGHGSLQPALWSIPRTIINSASHKMGRKALITVFGRHPQVDVSYLHGGNSEIYLVTEAATRLLNGLVTDAEPKNREVEAEKARARWKERRKD